MIVVIGKLGGADFHIVQLVAADNPLHAPNQGLVCAADGPALGAGARIDDGLVYLRGAGDHAVAAQIAGGVVENQMADPARSVHGVITHVGGFQRSAGQARGVNHLGLAFFVAVDNLDAFRQRQLADSLTVAADAAAEALARQALQCGLPVFHCGINQIAGAEFCAAAVKLHHSAVCAGYFGHVSGAALACGVLIGLAAGGNHHAVMLARRRLRLLHAGDLAVQAQQQRHRVANGKLAHIGKRVGSL